MLECRLSGPRQSGNTHETAAWGDAMTTTRRDFLGHLVTGVAVTGGFSKAAVQRKPLRNLVILLPGIMGSVLQKDGRDIWALSGAGIVTGIRSLGGSLRSLTLSGDSGAEDDLGDGVTASALIHDAHLIPGFWKIDGYSQISSFITTRFDAQKGRNFFEFPYDWRRDNRVAARRLARDSRRWLEAWRRSSGNSEARLILLAHSMGGLVARHFLEVLGGWRQTRMLVTFGTPYRGSLNAVDVLANGLRKTVGPLTVVDLSSLLRSFTSVYQLLPIYPCFDAGAGTLTRVAETSGIPNIPRDRAAQALAFHNEIRKASESNFQDAAYARAKYAIHPVIGNYQPTSQSAKLVNGTVVLSEMLGKDTSLKGDGTVPQPSARPIETPEAEKLHHSVYVSEVHGSLQNSDAVLHHLGGLLQEGAASDVPFRGSDAQSVAVMVDDLYSTSERVMVRARCEDPTQRLEATVTNVGSGVVIARAPIVSDRVGGTGEGAVGPLPEGTYRVTAGGGPDVGSATDVFIVTKA